MEMVLPGFVSIHTFAAPLKYAFNGLKTERSSGCVLLLVCGGSVTMFMPFSFANITLFKLMWLSCMGVGTGGAEGAAAPPKV